MVLTPSVVTGVSAGCRAGWPKIFSHSLHLSWGVDLIVKSVNIVTHNAW